MSDRVVIDGDMSLTSTIDGEGNAFIRIGQNPVIVPLNALENGTYDLLDGVDGYAPVTVAIPEYEGAYTVVPTTEVQTLPTAGKVMEQDVVINKTNIDIRLYSSKKVEADARYDTFDNFRQALFPDLPTGNDIVLIDFVNNTSNNRAGLYWVQFRPPTKDDVISAGKRVGGQFGGGYGCDVYAGAIINVYVGNY